MRFQSTVLAFNNCRNNLHVNWEYDSGVASESIHEQWKLFTILMVLITLLRPSKGALWVRPCSPTRLRKTRKVFENWTHLSRNDLRNHVWVTRCTSSVSWEGSLHQQLFLSIKSNVLKFKCQKPLLVNVSTPLSQELLLMESEVVWWQSTCCSTRCKLQSIRNEHHMCLGSHFTVTLERVRGPPLARRNGLSRSYISLYLISSTAYFCLFVWLLSVFGWWPLEICGA